MSGALPFGRLDRRRAFVSGGTQEAIGSAIVRSFAAAGADVTIGDLDIEAATELAGQVGATTVELDVNDVVMVKQIMGQHGPFDIVVNNAGADQHAFFDRHSAWRLGKTSCRQFGLCFACNPRSIAGNAVSWFRSVRKYCI